MLPIKQQSGLQVRSHHNQLLRTCIGWIHAKAFTVAHYHRRVTEQPRGCSYARFGIWVICGLGGTYGLKTAGLRFD